MASQPPGILGTFFFPGHGPVRARAGNGTFHRPTFANFHPLDDLQHGATLLLQSLGTAIGWNQTRKAAFDLVGQQSFTAGVVVGMGENLVKCVVSAVELLNTLALAEYWESRHDGSLAARLRITLSMAMLPVSSLGLATSDRYAPSLDRKAQEAFEERGAIADALAHAFTHPKEFFGTLTKAQAARAQEFVDLLKQRSLSGNFHAGVLMGELLFDLLMVIDLAVGLYKLALAVPRLARYTSDLTRLAKGVREAKQIEAKVATQALAEPGTPFTQTEKEAAANLGRSPAPSRPAGNGERMVQVYRGTNRQTEINTLTRRAIC